MPKILAFSLVSCSTTLVLMGCEVRTRHGEVVGVGVGVSVVRDDRWHYDHDYDDNWRHDHPWHGHKDW